MILKIICVQAEGSNAIASASATGERRPLKRADTMADSISVASPANGNMAAEYLIDSGGWAVE